MIYAENIKYKNSISKEYLDIYILEKNASGYEYEIWLVEIVQIIAMIRRDQDMSNCYDDRRCGMNFRRTAFGRSRSS